MAAFDGFGKDIPLDSAARQIVPEGWTVDYGEGVDSKATVSWSAAGDWQGALRSAVSRRGYSAQFGSNSVVISKSSEKTAEAPRPYASAPAKAAPPKKHVTAPKPKAQASVREEDFRGGGGFSIRPYRGADTSRLATKGDDAPAGNEAAQRNGFSVKEGQNLQPVLADWAAAAGWSLVWNSEFDYRIEASASFSGEFVDAATALITAMSGARPAITVDFYKGNHVMVVSNKSSDEVN